KGVDAYQHLTRLKLVSDWFPHQDWFYIWAAGMPAFDNYPGLPYVVSLPLVRLLGEVRTLELLALAAMVAFGLGFYGHVRVRTGDRRTAFLATVMVVTSMAIWHYVLASGVYARVVAMGFGGLAWWAHSMALSRRSGRWWALTAVFIALTIACHPVTGAFVAGYIAVVQLSEMRLGGIRPLVALGALSFLLAAQPILSSLSFGIGGTILGVDRPELGYSDKIQLVAPQFAGFAAFSIPVLVVLLSLPRRFWKSLGAGLALAAVIAYMFAPNFHVPTRDYYAFAQLNVDWLYWAYDTLYHPPINDARYRAVLDWYALDTMTFSSSDEKGEPDVASLSFVRLVPETKDTPFRLYRVDSPTAIAATTKAPLGIVVGSRSDYDRVARLLFDEGASPRTRVPVWWNGTLADLPDDLAARAASVIVVGAHLGETAAATRHIEALTAAGANVLWDVGDLPDTTLPDPWPVRQVKRLPIDRWTVTDRAGRIAEGDFSPASFEGGPWGATVPVAAATGATVELTSPNYPLIVSAIHSKGTLVVVGGNLLYHAQSKANQAERRYVLSFLGPPATAGETEPRWRFVDPERREIETDGSPVLLKESIYSKWSARFVADDGTERALRIDYAGPGLMLALPPGPGTVVFEYSSTLTIGWVGWGLTGVGLVLALLLARRRTVFVPAPPRPRDDDDLDED